MDARRRHACRALYIHHGHMSRAHVNLLSDCRLLSTAEEGQSALLPRLLHGLLKGFLYYQQRVDVMSCELLTFRNQKMM